MNTQWTLETHGDPLGTVRNFVQTIWQEAKLDGMLVTLNGHTELIAKPQLVDTPGRLSEVNPFKPLMTFNTARFVPALLKEYPTARFGALLRPCEMRALIEMSKHDHSITCDELLTVCVDCLGTLPADEFHWRAERKESADSLTQEALQFARQGGMVAYRYRSACQMCISPEARGADINIHVLGLPARQYILVSARNALTEERLHLSTITGGKADIILISQHDRTLARMTERHQRTMERIAEGLGSLLPSNVDALITQLQSCDRCQACFNVCPICSVDPPKRSADNHYDRKEITRWLISCAGCGMCEQSCPSHLPLSTIFFHIHQQLAQEWDYIAGRSVDEPLPVL